MIDTHSHILSGLDDGASDLNESIQMALIAHKDGINEIVCTPHISDVYSITPSKIDDKIDILRENLKNKKINIILHYGCEVQVNLEIIKKYRDKMEQITVNKKGKYIFLELSFTDIPMYLEDMIKEIISYDITPIIVHPLRNIRLLDNINLMYSLREKGAMFQFDKETITDGYNIKTSHLAYELIKNNITHFIASDAHSATERRPTLSCSYRKIEKHFSKKIAEQIFNENPSNLIKGEIINDFDLKNKDFFDKLKNIFIKRSMR